MPGFDHSRSHLGYRPALDGIRALAVAAVVLFHAGVGGVAGGFLGVDTFFVLSGFLITSLPGAPIARALSVPPLAGLGRISYGVYLWHWPLFCFVTAQLSTAIGIAGSRGAAVVLLTAAYTHRAEQPDGSLYPEDQPQRVDAWNGLLRTVAAQRPEQVSVLDIDPLVCPGGKFTWRIDGMRVRSDGLHYTPEAVQRIIAPWLLPQLARIAESGSTG